MKATAKKVMSAPPSAAKIAEQGRKIKALHLQVSHLTRIVQKLNHFIASADLNLGDYELTAGEILTLESRVKNDLAKARKKKALKTFDGSLSSLVAT